MSQRSVGWALKRVLHHGGVLALARLARRRDRAMVLRYHALTPTTDDVPYAAPDICLDVSAFRLQMAFLKRAYRVLSLDALVASLERGGALPPRAAAITFDDGYTDNYTLGGPVLRALGLPATVYVATGSVDDASPFWVAAVRAIGLEANGEMLEVPGVAPIPLGPRAARGPAIKALTRALVPLEIEDRAERITRVARAAGVDVLGILRGTMLSWQQIREMAAAGWTIGAHTINHANVALADPAVAQAEIAGSRDAIAAAVGTSVCHFCYPNTGGQARYCGPDVAEILRGLGFRSGTTSRPGALRRGADPFLLPRLGVSPRLGPVPDLAAALERQRLAA